MKRLLWAVVVWIRPGHAAAFLHCHATETSALCRTTAAAGRGSRVEESPAAPQALPKRGEAWAKSPADVQFMQEGHVYFTDSVSATLQNL